MSANDLTAIYYTANHIHDRFAERVRNILREALGDTPLISVSKIPINFGHNICVGNTPRSHLNIYRQALVGAKAADTKYIALCEDDVLYPVSHFKYRPATGVFAYNLNVWNFYTWTPIFSHKENGRRNLYGLICERDLFIEAMEERFARWPDDSKINLGLWAEPGKYENQLKVTVRKSEGFYSDVSLVAFSHEESLSFGGLGKRKKLGEVRATAIPLWGDVSKVLNLYHE